MGFFNRLFGKSKPSKDIVLHSLQRELDVINESAEIMEKTMNPDTFFSRYDFYIDKLAFMAEKEKNGVQGIQFSGESLAEKYKLVSTHSTKVETINNFIDRIWEDTRKKAESLQTEKGRKNRYQMLYDDLSAYEHKMPDECIKHLQELFQTSICEAQIKALEARREEKHQRNPQKQSGHNRQVDVSTTTQNGLRSTEILLLKYCSFGSYPNPKNGYPTFWQYKYGIDDVDTALKSLEERGFIQPKSAVEMLPKLTVPMLKELLASFGLPTSGKKNDLISRIQSEVDEASLEMYIPDRKYVLTDLGQNELNKHHYVADAHSRGEPLPDILRPNDQILVPAHVSRDDASRADVQRCLSKYKSSGFKQYVFHATLDITTCPECGKLDMKRFLLSEAKEGVNLPPMHPGCRCMIVPEIDESTLAESQRAARDPVTHKSNTVPGNMSYSEWYEAYVKGNPEAEANYKITQSRQ